MSRKFYCKQNLNVVYRNTEIHYKFVDYEITTYEEIIEVH